MPVAGGQAERVPGYCWQSGEKGLSLAKSWEKPTRGQRGRRARVRVVPGQGKVPSKLERLEGKQGYGSIGITLAACWHAD